MFFFCFVILAIMVECSNLWKMVRYKYFCLMCFVSSRIWAGPCVEHGVFGKNCESMFYSFVPFGFNSAMRSMSPGRSVQTYEDCSNLVFLAICVLFLKFLGRLRSGIYWNCLKWLKLKTIGHAAKWSHLVACSMVFNLLCNLSQQVSLVKRTKNAQL